MPALSQHLALAIAIASMPLCATAQTRSDNTAIFPGALGDYRGMPRQKPGSDKICLQRKRGGDMVCHTREHWWRLAAKPSRRR